MSDFAEAMALALTTGLFFILFGGLLLHLFDDLKPHKEVILTKETHFCERDDNCWDEWDSWDVGPIYQPPPLQTEKGRVVRFIKLSESLSGCVCILCRDVVVDEACCTSCGGQVHTVCLSELTSTNKCQNFGCNGKITERLAENVGAVT